MILKKPYGLLIKYFKLIHLILTLLTIYVAFNTKTILNFFQDYVSNNYYVAVFNNMASKYIAPFLYLSIVIILIMFIALFVLLKYKKKPNTFYLISMGYYLLLLVMVIISANLINGLNRGFWETVAARQYRDFAQIIYWPQYLFIFLLGIRTLGFDVKKFDFKKDIQELELTENDSELVEINIEFDTTKLRRTIRRLIREFKYYFLENKFIIMIISIILIALLGFSIFKSHEQTLYNYKQGSSFNYDGFTIKIMDSLITNLDYKGNKISDDNYYLLIKLNIKNNSKNNKKIDYNNFKLNQKNNYYNPSLDIGINFLDYGEPYFGDTIKVDASKTYLLSYIIDKKIISSDFQLSINNGYTIKNKELKKINIKLNPIIIDEVSLVNNFKINQEINFSGTYLNESKLNVLNYLISKSYNYKYKTCDSCPEYTSYVTAKFNSSIKRTLLVLDYNFYLDPTSEYYASAQSVHTFFNNFASIRYTLNDVEKNVNAEDITPTEIKDKVILQVPAEIEDASKIDLYITIRNKIYIVNLK